MHHHNLIPMKKQFALLLLLSVCMSFHMQAQIRMGILAGPQSSSVIETNNLPDWNDLKDGFKPRGGFHAGFIADIPFSTGSKLYFQPGVIYSTKGTKFSQSY